MENDLKYKLNEYLPINLKQDSSESEMDVAWALWLLRRQRSGWL
jgi:hypothetical protein